MTWTEVTKKVTVEEVEGSSRDGAYVNGLSVQGARWDVGANQLDRSKPKEMFCKMPVINVKALAADKVTHTHFTFINKPSQHTLSITYQHILSSYPLDTLYQNPYQPIFLHTLQPPPLQPQPGGYLTRDLRMSHVQDRAAWPHLRLLRTAEGE